MNAKKPEILEEKEDKQKGKESNLLTFPLHYDGSNFTTCTVHV